MKKYYFILPLIFILGLAYCRYTYMLNPNFSGETMLIKIKQTASLGGQSYDANSVVNAKSIIYYWVLFFIGIVIFFQALFHSKEKNKIIMALYLLISLFSVGFFSLDYFLI